MYKEKFVLQWPTDCFGGNGGAYCNTPGCPGGVNCSCYDEVVHKNTKSNNNDNIKKEIIDACLDTTGPAIKTICSECPAYFECDIENFKDRIVKVDLSPS